MELICAARGAFAQRVLRLTPRQAGTNSDADVITALFWSPPPAAWLDDRPKKLKLFSLSILRARLNAVTASSS